MTIKKTLALILEVYKKSPKLVRLIALSVAIIFSCIILFNLGKTLLIKYLFARYTPPAISVSTAKVQEIQWQPKISTIGNFSAINGVDVNSESPGNVTKIYFKSGQFIKKGEPLLDIDDSVEQAVLKFNEADLSLQNTEYKRQADLLNKNATSTSSVDQARAKLLEAEANLDKTKASIEQKHIKAPFSGVLGIRQVSLGQYIQPGKTGIVSLQSLDPIFLKFYLPEHLISNIHKNQLIMFEVDQNPKYIFAGKVTAINSKSDIKTHNIEIQAKLSNCSTKDLLDIKKSKIINTKKPPLSNKVLIECNTKKNHDNNITDFNFMPGMFAEINIIKPPKNKVLIVPKTAISFTMYGDSVFVVEKDPNFKKGKKGKDIFLVKRVFVTTGDDQGNYIIIKKGLEKGQTIVSSGELKLQDNTRVTINNSVKLTDSTNIETLGQ
ncbi:MAG: efflux transporter periplasmic adaptor subunit [Legionellales bacterium RIFCSPHIGHO2_12_FULL_35_11]|nr:MAG: efflux transporter periplasmic adaptor subunit [Legionellales bacterium RIFCSPHIGHO2_12_FULL_35_11]